MKKRPSDNPLSRLPSVDALLSAPESAKALDQFPRPLVVQALRRLVADMRSRLLADPEADLGLSGQQVEDACRQLRQGSLRRVINATGVVVHTNLGRSPLPSFALEKIADISQGYSNLEYDLDAGKRSSRHGHAVFRLKEILGAEDALVVNNNAAAVFLALAALAKGRQVVVSRGELVEIGGSFRIPDVMTQSGAVLVEVGTTNKTKIRDYTEAVTDQTALLLKVHRSNFAMVGFTEEASVEELARLGKETGIPTMVDLGSGCFEDAYAAFSSGRFPEQGADRILAAGIDLVSFSGDKLLGGPQAGILAGRADLIDRLRSHPFMRVVRPGKMTFAVLDAVLDRYQWGLAATEIPTVRMLCEPTASVHTRAEQLLSLIDGTDDALSVSLTETVSRVGGGAQPLLDIPSVGITLEVSGKRTDELANALRMADPPVVSRVADGLVILDLRTIQPFEVDELAACIRQAVGRLTGP